MQSFIDNGVMVTGGSDSPVTSYFCPLQGISHAIGRMDKNIGMPPYNRKECASVPDMVDAFTCNAAYQLKRDNETGKIQKGYYADFVLLSEDVYSVDRQNIQDIVPVMTVYRGEVVYERAGLKYTDKHNRRKKIIE
jgi:predicted amidohydrolase YtcJ